MRRNVLWATILTMTLAGAVFAERTRLKPGMNFFSPQQDVDLGQQVSREAERELPILNDSRINSYLGSLGRRLASHAPGERYPYQFRAVNDSSINAFALPGGFLYVNRGTIEAADNEAELAGVIGHEIGHVALRHGTNQASKAYLAQAPLAVLGGVVGSNSIGALMAQLGTGFAMNSVLLKYSRDAERQADIMGAQIVFDSNYDPQYLSEFFRKLQSKGGGSDFFSSHPNPQNRSQIIHTEVSKLGAHRGAFVNDTSEFHEIQQILKSMPRAPRRTR
jgi:beta-barrel assembly-enhancing protease